jgi:hypothetical protein
MVIMLTAIALLHYFFQPAQVSVTAIAFLLLGTALLIAVSLTPINGKFKILYQTCSVVFLVNIYFNLVYYPNLIIYQSDNEAAFWLNEHNTARLPVVQKKNGYSHAMNFYLNQPLQVIAEGTVLPPRPYILFADSAYIGQMVQEGQKVRQLKSFDQFRVTRMNGKFLNHKTRAQAVGTDQLVVIE